MDTPYTVFIGREIADSGFEYFVTVELVDGRLACSAYTDITDVCLDLHDAVRERKRVMLTKMPDFLPRPSVPCHPTTTYDTLTEEQIYALQHMYKMIQGIEKYPDPFRDQPREH